MVRSRRPARRLKKETATGCRPRRNGNTPAARERRPPFIWATRSMGHRRTATAQSPMEPMRRGEPSAADDGRLVRSQCVRPVRHARECLGVVLGLV